MQTEGQVQYEKDIAMFLQTKNPAYRASLRKQWKRRAKEALGANATSKEIIDKANEYPRDFNAQLA